MQRNMLLPPIFTQLGFIKEEGLDGTDGLNSPILWSSLRKLLELFSFIRGGANEPRSLGPLETKSSFAANLRLYFTRDIPMTLSRFSFGITPKYEGNRKVRD